MIKYGFYNSLNGDRVYDANDISTMFEGVFSDGVFENVGNGLQVEEDPGMMGVLVRDGRAWFNDTWIRNTSTLSLAIAPAHLIDDRIDLVVLEFNSDIVVRENSIKVITGTPAAIPVPPALVNTLTVKQYALAEIYVSSGVSEIEELDITNKIGTIGTPYATNLLGPITPHTHNAGDIISGTLDSDLLPKPTTTTVGGVKRNTGSAGEYVTGIDANGNLEYDTPAGGGGGRDLLVANRTYYVRTDGNNSNDGLTDSAGGSFLTIQKAIDVVASLDISIYNVDIQVKDGTYTTPVVINKPFVGSGTVTIKGNSGTPSNVLIHTTSSHCFTAKNGAVITLKDFKVQTTTSGTCLYAENLSTILFSNLVFGAAATNHMLSTTSSVIWATGNYSITAGALRHFFVTGVATLVATGITITLTGTPAFSVAFAQGSLAGVLSGATNTFSGSATGPRYSASVNGVVYTGGGGANYFPGNSAGSTSTGGQYL